ncbi:hypothetical protein QX201_007712 [Fusarium graminearum]
MFGRCGDESKTAIDPGSIGGIGAEVLDSPDASVFSPNTSFPEKFPLLQVPVHVEHLSKTTGACHPWSWALVLPAWDMVTPSGIRISSVEVGN